jgi:hypothetical protein
MKKHLNLSTLMLLLFMAGCQKDIQPTIEQNISEETMAKSPSAGNTTINLSVEVDDLAGNQILSDGQGEYINGVGRVQAQILSSDGNFYMNTNNNTVKQPIRTMQFLPTNPELNLSGKRNYSLRTTATIRLQDMLPTTSQNVGMRAWGVEQGGVVNWKIKFRNGINASPLTDYAKVTRISNDRWTIEPANDPGVTPANAELTEGNDNHRGYYIVPFRLTLTRIP